MGGQTQTFRSYISAQCDFDELTGLWNEYGAREYPDEYIFDSVEEFCNTYNPEPAKVARMVFFGDIESWLDKVYLNGYGNFKSCWSIESSPIDLDVLARVLEEEDHQLYQDWQEEQEEQEEQEDKTEE